MRIQRFALLAIAALSIGATGTSNAQVIKELSGQWSGMARFSARIAENGRSLEDETAKAYVEIYMSIDKLGNITGRTTSNHCQINGLATPWVFPTSLDIQINLTGCKHAGFNRRLNGKFLYRPQKRNADMTLSTIAIDSTTRRWNTYDIKANVGF